MRKRLGYAAVVAVWLIALLGPVAPTGEWRAQPAHAQAPR